MDESADMKRKITELQSLMLKGKLASRFPFLPCRIERDADGDAWFLRRL
jgi:hypothetical protein